LQVHDISIRENKESQIKEALGTQLKGGRNRFPKRTGDTDGNLPRFGDLSYRIDKPCTRHIGIHERKHNAEETAQIRSLGKSGKNFWTKQPRRWDQ
jgi:hypothetical protein